MIKGKLGAMLKGKARCSYKVKTINDNSAILIYAPPVAHLWENRIFINTNDKTDTLYIINNVPCTGFGTDKYGQGDGDRA